MKVKSDTIARTIVLMLTLVNLVLGLLGKTALDIDESVIYDACSVGAVILAAAVSWWKNNSFTQAALKADEVMKSEKALKDVNGSK